jgi:imidazolonepropionase-like amidohydrolase
MRKSRSNGLLRWDGLTDAQNPGTAHGASLHEELDILVRCGLTPDQALISATSAAARVWGFKDRGRIATGFSDLTSCSEQTYTDLHDQVVYHQTTREPKRPGAWNEKSVSPYRSETAP